MVTRLNGILTSLAQNYAYHLLQKAPAKVDDVRVRYLADSLANNGFLIIVADIPENSFDVLMRVWINNYNRLYNVISSMLFPMYTSINIGTADAMRPPVVVIQGESTAVIQVMAGYIVPYVAMRQHTNTISDAEIIGLMTYILADLEADELPRRQYDELSRQCAQIIRDLIRLPIEHYSLTVMKKPLFQQNHVVPKQMPDKKSRPAPPPNLPGTGRLNPEHLNGRPVRPVLKSNQDKTQPMPIWFNIDDDIERTKPQPPVIWNPLISEDDDEDK